MNLDTIKKYNVAILFLLSISSVYANDRMLVQENIRCPLLENVKTAATQLDTALKVNDKYITYTANSILHEDNLWWFAGVGNITATSSNEAITIGKKILTNANIQIDIYAKKVGNEFICNYGPGYIQARGKEF